MKDRDALRAGRAPEGPAAEPFTSLGPAPTGATGFACPLCGCRFSHGEHVCGTCPLHMGCDLVRCPHCGYSFPRTSRLVTWVRRLIGRTEGAA